MDITKLKSSIPTHGDCIKAVDQENLQEIRCKKCRRLLMKGSITYIEIKCPKCNSIQKFRNV